MKKELSIQELIERGRAISEARSRGGMKNVLKGKSYFSEMGKRSAEKRKALKAQNVDWR